MAMNDGDPISIPTPDISHLTEDDYEHVYEPAGTSLEAPLSTYRSVDLSEDIGDS